MRHTIPGTTVEPLTDREREVLSLVAQGRTNGEIAAALGISFATAKAHVSHILTKLGVESREEAARWWDRRGDPGGPSKWGRWLRGVTALPWLKVGAGAGLTSAGVAAVAVIAIAVGASAGDREDNPAANATTPTAEDESVEEAQGPLLVYMVPSEAEGARTIVVYDTVQQQVLNSFDVGLPEYPAYSVALAGDLLITSLGGDRLATYALDGQATAEYTFASPSGAPAFVLDTSPSPDGRMFAVPTGPSPHEEQLYIIDLAGEREVLRVDRTTPGLEDFIGGFQRVEWRADGSGVTLIGGTRQWYGSMASIGLDGSVQRFDLDPPREAVGGSPVRFRPDGLALARMPYRPFFGCVDESAHRLLITDTDTGAVLQRVEDAEDFFVDFEWSPDGTQLLVGTLGPEDDPCDVDNPTGWRVVDADTGATVHGAVYPLAVRSAWNLGRDVTFHCDGEQTHLLWSDRGDISGGCPEGEVELRANSRTVDAVEGSITVLGWIELTED